MITHLIKLRSAGHTLIELLVAMGLLAIVMPALLAGLALSTQSNQRHEKRQQAQAILNETQEALRAIRASGWATIANPGTYHPVLQAGEWQLATGSATQNGFTSTVTISAVRRSSASDSGTIVQTGGWIDPSTVKIDYTVSWQTENPLSISASTYMTRYLDNLTHSETTVAEFTGITGNKSVLQGTTITNTSGGEVTLSNSANADWCKPQSFIVNQINLPKLSNAIYSKQGGAYLGSGDGASNSPAFINVAITDPSPPASPSASVVGTYNEQFTTNSIYSDGRYVYLATSVSPQIKILDLTTNPYSEVGTVTIPGGAQANSVYLSSNNNILFATSGNKLYTFDVTNKVGSHTTVKSSITMRASIWSQPTARQVYVVGNRAYVGTGNSLLGMQTFSFNTDGSNLSFVAAALLTFSQESQGLYVDSQAHYAYIAFNNASGIAFTRGMVVIDLTRTSWFLITYYNRSYTYSTGGMDPRGITVPTSTRAVVVGVGGGSSPGTEQYQVVDTSSLSNQNPSLTYCGGYPIASGVYGVSSLLDQFNTAYSYIITGEAGNQFKIIRGGEGGGGYVSSGTFESKILDPLFSTGFNSFSATVNPQSQTVKMQLAVAPPVSGSCTGATYTYVGPKGVQGASPSAYFTPVGNIISGTVPFGSYGGYTNPARCFKYKVFLETTNNQVSPALNDFIVNYSP